jgi:hypothetical protein
MQFFSVRILILTVFGMYACTLQAAAEPSGAQTSASHGLIPYINSATSPYSMQEPAHIAKIHAEIAKLDNSYLQWIATNCNDICHVKGSFGVFWLCLRCSGFGKSRASQFMQGSSSNLDKLVAPYLIGGAFCWFGSALAFHACLKPILAKRRNALGKELREALEQEDALNKKNN